MEAAQERFLKVAAEAVGAAAEGLHEDNERAARGERLVSRSQLLADIEKAIVAARPDVDEASELLDAISAALTARYGAAYEDGVEHDLKDLQKALAKVEPFAGIEA